jgi:Beta-lactamase
MFRIGRLVLGLVVLLAGVGCSSNPSPDVVCDIQDCISISALSTKLANALNGNVVGYNLFVGTATAAPSVFSGQARTSADPPSVPMLPYLSGQIASLSKPLTTIGVLQSLANHNLTIDSTVSRYLPSDWVQGPYIFNLTFRQLLTQASGLDTSNVCNNGNSNYQSLRQMIAAGRQPILIPPYPPHYDNCNFAIFRVLLPAMEGYPIPPPPPPGFPDLREVVTAADYIDYMNKHVFLPVGISGADCKPPAPGSYNSASAPILSYPFPAGNAHGTDWGDFTLNCGAGGWFLKTGDLTKVMDDLAGGNKLLTNAQKSTMFQNSLGWDDAVRQDCPSPYPCKNGGYFATSNTGQPIALRTYLGLFKCTVLVVLYVNSDVTAAIRAIGAPSGNDIIGLVGQAYQLSKTKDKPPSGSRKCPA